MDISEIDPTKVNFKVDYRFLAREVTLTLQVSDDETYKLLVGEVQKIEKEITKEMAELKNLKP